MSALNASATPGIDSEQFGPPTRSTSQDQSCKRCANSAAVAATSAVRMGTTVSRGPLSVVSCEDTARTIIANTTVYSRHRHGMPNLEEKEKNLLDYRSSPDEPLQVAIGGRDAQSQEPAGDAHKPDRATRKPAPNDRVFCGGVRWGGMSPALATHPRFSDMGDMNIGESKFVPARNSLAVHCWRCISV